MPTSPIQSPASYVPSRAAAFADTDGSALVVSSANPLPVTLAAAAPASAPMAGNTAVSGVLGPFQPTLDRPVMLALSGTWTGSVRVLRSTDGGVTRLPLTVAASPWAQFTANCCEPVWEEASSGAELYLDIALSSGTLAYRIEQ